MTTPRSKGLFRHVIGESGAVILVGDPLTLAQAEKQGELFAGQWNTGDDPLKTMRAVPAAEILKKEPNYYQAPPANLGITIDGYVFPRRPADVFADGQEHRVDLLLGNNSRERIPGTTPPSDLTKAVEDSYALIAKQALAIYVGAADPLYGTPADQWATDTSFRCPAVLQLMWHARAGNTAFEFQFDRAPPDRESVGATHSAELEYVFDTFGSRKPTPAAHYDAVDHTISDAMQQYWTRLACRS